MADGSAGIDVLQPTPDHAGEGQLLQDLFVAAVFWQKVNHLEHAVFWAERYSLHLPALRNWIVAAESTAPPKHPRHLTHQRLVLPPIEGFGVFQGAVQAVETLGE